MSDWERGFVSGMIVGLGLAELFLVAILVVR